MYLSNKTVHFSYKGGCSICEHTHVNVFKRAWAIDKQFRVNSNKMLFKTVIPLRN